MSSKEIGKRSLGQRRSILACRGENRDSAIAP